MRMIKIGLAFAVGLQALFYMLQNVVNLDGAYSSVEAVLTMAGHEIYPKHFGPAITAPLLIWAALVIVMTFELLAGVLAIIGGFAMIGALGADRDQFSAASKNAIRGAGVAVLIWFGFFMAFGGAYFQMWQTPIGIASLEGAFMYAMSSGLALLILNQPEQ